MDGKGRALDNIYIERLWRSVKYECIYLNTYENGVQLYHGLMNILDFTTLKESVNHLIIKILKVFTIKLHKIFEV